MTLSNLSLDHHRIRKDTPLFARSVYLDAAAAAPPPLPVVEGIASYLKDLSRLGPYLPSFRAKTYEQVEEVRSKAAALIGARPHEVAFTSNGTEGLNLVANGLDWQEGDEVVLLDVEFHSNVVPWLRLERERGVKVRTVTTDGEGMTTAEAVLAAVGPRTRLVTISHVLNALGTVQPVEEIGQALKQIQPQVLYLVNAAQSLGLLPLHVDRLHCDFLAAPGRKWLRGPEGSGILYVREDHLGEIRPTLVGWGGTEWQPAARTLRHPATAKRFQAGLPNIPAILGLGLAVDYANQLGVAATAAQTGALVQQMDDLLRRIPGLAVYGPVQPEHRAGIISFNVTGVDPKRLVTVLAEQGVIIEAGTFMAEVALAKYGQSVVARVSPHYYNTEQDLVRMADLTETAARGAES